MVAGTAELCALPWELLTLSSGRHLGEVPGLAVVYRWPGAKIAADTRPATREGGRVLVA